MWVVSVVKPSKGVRFKSEAALGMVRYTVRGVFWDTRHTFVSWLYPDVHHVATGISVKPFQRNNFKNKTLHDNGFKNVTLRGRDFKI